MISKYLGSLFMLAWNRIVLFNSYELNAGNTYMVYLDSLVLMHGSNVKREQQESGMSQITPPPQIIYTQPERKFITSEHSSKIITENQGCNQINSWNFPPFLAGFRDMIDTE